MAQRNAGKHERAYHETLVLLRRAQQGASTATDQADWTLIQSLEKQLNDANQQLRQLCAERALNTADGQMAVQQSQTNEQLKALLPENAEVHKAIAQLAAERDSARKAQGQLQFQTLNARAILDADSNTPKVRCLQAEAEVIELKGKIVMMNQRSGYR